MKFKKIANRKHVSSSNLKDCLMKVLKLLLHLISHALALNHINIKLRVKFDCHCLKSS